jgi:hypothetical protein
VLCNQICAVRPKLNPFNLCRRTEFCVVGQNFESHNRILCHETGCRAHGFPIFTVEGCFGARKQDRKIFLSFNESKTSQLDKHWTCFGQRQCEWQPVSIVSFSRGPFLTSRLGANFYPRNEFVPQGWIFSPMGVKLSPGGEILCLPHHSSKQ